MKSKLMEVYREDDPTSQGAVTAPGRPTGVREQLALPAAALVLSALALGAVMVVSGQVVPPLLVFALILTALAGAVLRWRDARWPLIVAAVASAIPLAGVVSFGAGDLTHPETFFSFVPTIGAMASLSVALAVSLLGATRRAPNVSAVIAGSGVAIFAIALGLSLIATLAADDDARLPGDAVIVAEDIEFPERIVLQAAGSGVFIENKDRTRHTFVIEAQNVKQELPGSTSRRLEVNLRPGEYRFYCDVPGHERMEGTLVVN